VLAGSSAFAQQSTFAATVIHGLNTSPSALTRYRPVTVYLCPSRQALTRTLSREPPFWVACQLTGSVSKRSYSSLGQPKKPKAAKATVRLASTAEYVPSERSRNTNVMYSSCRGIATATAIGSSRQSPFCSAARTSLSVRPLGITVAAAAMSASSMVGWPATAPDNSAASRKPAIRCLCRIPLQPVVIHSAQHRGRALWRAPRPQ
jgi:hypothetical protein